MLIALGVFTTLLFVLLFGRGLWALLGRWSGWKEARKVPRTIRDLQAERDGLKAEKAMMASKLDASMSDMKLRLAEQMAEVSRNRNRLLDANGKMQGQADHITKLQGVIANREEKISALNSQIEENVKAIAQAWAKTAEHESDAARFSGMHKEAISAINIREDRIRNLEGEAKALREIIAAFLPGRDVAKDIPSMLGHNSAAHNSIAHNSLSLTRSLLSDVAENVTVLPEPAINNFQARFNVNNPLDTVNPQSASMGSMANDPFSAPVHVNDEPVPFPQDSVTVGPLEKGISNVLSLAERVRGLKNDLKKQS
jgi:enamine deaminase RidA (YjgF/YER057c/UK114 family)